MTIYFTSDLHLNHKNILEYCPGRNCKTIQEMNELLIRNWNNVVTQRDEVYVLGDFGFGGDCQKFFDRLLGNKYLIMGNHDHKTKEIKHLGWAWVKDTYELKHSDNRFWLSHYSHRVWPHSHKGSICLHGHSHGSLPPFGKSFDVGVDVWNMTPISIEQVIKYADTLEQVKGLHHGQ